MLLNSFFCVLRSFFFVLRSFFLDFWCWGATSAALGAPVRARGGSQGRFWSDLGGHFGAIGGPGVTLWGHIGALDGVFWDLFCSVYFRLVCCSNLLPKLSQKGVPGHGIM